MKRKMKDALSVFRRGMREENLCLADNYYLLVNAAESVRKGLKGMKWRFQGKNFPDSLFESCIKLCKNGKLPTDEETVEFFGGKSGLLTAEYLPLCITGALVEYAARGVKTKNQNMLIESVRSIRRIAELDFDKISANLSESEEVLRRDAVYPMLDEETRAHYRRNISLGARKKRVSEKDFVLNALGKAEKDSCHIGRYIIPTSKKKTRGRLLIAMQFLMPAAVCAASGILFGFGFMPFLCYIPFYIIFRRPIERAIMAGVEPDRLPRLKTDIPQVQTVPVMMAVSTLIPAPEKASSFGKRLEKLYLSNKTEGLTVCCLADFKGAPSPTMPEDKTCVSAMCSVIDRLNKKYSGGFVFAVRERVYSKTQDEYTGRERKRGAITDLVNAIGGKSDSFSLIYGDKSSFNKTRYIFTLDADSVPEFNALSKLVAIAEHPLNRPVIDEKTGRVTRGYGIIVPKSENRIRYENSTLFERIMSGANATGGYDSLSGEKYRDLFGESIFCGKGLIDVEAYRRLLCDLHSERILSHDSVEGGYLRAGLAGDVTVTDAFVPDADGYFKRLGRWVRGDWQNAPFIFGKNPLNPLSRYKLFDNILRSLFKPFCVAAIVSSLFLGERESVCTAAVSLLSLCIEDIYSAAGSFRKSGFAAASRLYFTSVVPESVLCIVRAFISVAFSVREAALCVFSAIKAVWRMTVTKRNLLEWVPAGSVKGKTVTKILSCIFTVAVSVLIFAFGLPIHRLIALVLLFDAPLFLLSGVRTRVSEPKITAENREKLIAYAGATWSFFSEHCTAENNFLPPDNIQLSPVRAVAKRTSPTNIGLMLVSFLAARDLGFITTQEMYVRLETSLKTVEKLEKFKGNLLNWYSVSDCVPLEPRYVSAVDNGNFLCCLTALKEGIGEYIGECPSLAETQASVQKLIDNTDLSVLYNRRRRLFHIGINPETGEKSSSFYDLLMSESRMMSYYAVAKRLVPENHWDSLGRICIGAGRHIGLASWTGTAFEYFMPCLFLPCPEGSESRESMLFCLNTMRKTAGKRPFGISESGFYSFDGAMNYQYKANGAKKLGLCRDIDENVVSPYSSFLTAVLAPNTSVRNLRRLEKYGMLGKYGFFEALDFSKNRVSGEYAVVHSFMAHHQGMSLVAAVNALQDNRMQKRFMRDPDMKGASTLLDKKISTEMKIFKDISSLEVPETRKQSLNENKVIKNPSLTAPEAAVYSNSRMSVCITDCGTGHTVTDGLDVTVRSNDILGRPSGVFAVFTSEKIRLTSSKALGGMGEHTAEFTLNQAIHTAEHKNIRLTMKTSVSEDSNCEIRSFIIENRGKKEISGKLTVYFEPCLEKTADFSAHRAYSKLFLTDEWDEKNGCAVFVRNTKSGNMPAIAAGFTDNGGVRRYFSRESVLTTPMGIFSLGMRENMKEGRGVPDCCCCFETEIKLSAGERQSKKLLIVVDENKEAAINGFIRAENKAKIRFAKALFRADSLENTIASCVVPRILYPKSLTECSGKEKFGLEDLWAFGISGDLPIIALKISDEDDASKIRPYVRVNKQLCSCGIASDLVVIYPADDGYNPIVRNALRSILKSEGCELMLGVKGGVHLVNQSRFSHSQIQALKNFSSFYADVANFDANCKKTLFRPLEIVPENKMENSKKNAKSVKCYDFTNGKIAIKNKGETVDIPWNMVLANKSFGTMVSDKALGFTWAINSRQNKLTPWYSDTASDNRGEMLIWKYNGTLYDIIALSTAVFSPDKAQWKAEIKGVSFTVTVSVPERGMTKKISVETENKSGYPRDGELAFYTLPVLGVSRDEVSSFCAVKTPYGAIISNGASENPGYMSLEIKPGADFVCFSRVEFLEGRWNQNNDDIPYDCCFSAGRKIYLESNEKMNTDCFLSWGASLKSARMMSDVSAFERRIQNPLKLDCENKNLNTLFNSFLYPQILQSRFYGKTGFYQCSGAYGFRDQLQDSLAFLLTDPKLTRTHLLRCAAVQFPEGDVLHWWHVTVNKKQTIRGIRSKCSDDMLWLPFVCCEYVRNTDDYSVLNTEIPFIETDYLTEHEKERYVTPKRSEKKATLFEHCVKSIEKACNFGKNGLPLIGSCDWNDAMNNIGTDQEGESVWLAMFLIIVLEKFSLLCQKFGYDKKHQEYVNMAAELRKIIEEKAWLGDRYARVILNNGHPPGDEEYIDILPQAFAVFSGLKHAEVAVETAVEKLVDREKRIIKLLSPPFNPESREKIGYIAAYPEGIRENAGQYTHAAVWLAMALFSLGRKAEGRDLVDIINPMGYYSDKKLAESYKAEPYVLAGDVYSNENVAPRGGWTHFTGSVAWFYRCIAENYSGLSYLPNRKSENGKISYCKVFDNYNPPNNAYELIKIQKKSDKKSDSC